MINKLFLVYILKGRKIKNKKLNSIKLFFTYLYLYNKGWDKNIAPNLSQTRPKSEKIKFLTFLSFSKSYLH